MQIAREEIAEAIRRRKLIFFETIPLGFDTQLKEAEEAEDDQEYMERVLKLNHWSIVAD